MKQKIEKIAHYNSFSKERDVWIKKNSYYHQKIISLIRFLIPENTSVLDIGCGNGDLLTSLKPSQGIGFDFADKVIAEANIKYEPKKHPDIKLQVDDIEKLEIEGIFNYVVMSDVVGDLNDVWQAFRNIRNVTDENSRLVITYYNSLWEPVLTLGEMSGLKMPQPKQNWLSPGDIKNLLDLNGFEIIKEGQELIFPKYIPLFSSLTNTFFAHLPFIKKLGLTNYLVAKKVNQPLSSLQEMSVTVIIPCRNERGNIRSAIERLPKIGSHTEILFVDGNSNDGTVEEIENVINEYKDKDIKLRSKIYEFIFIDYFSSCGFISRNIQLF